MFAQLGTTIFEGLFSWHEFEREMEARYAEIALISGKPDLQRVGSELDTISFSLRLHSDFCIPSLRISELKGYCDNGDILPLLDGYGNLWGTFVLKKLKQKTLQEDGQGGISFADMEVTLKEYIDPNKRATQQANAQRNAFAIDKTSLSLNLTTPPLSLSSDLVKSVNLIDGSSALAAQQVQQAVAVPEQSAATMRQAAKAAGSAIAAAQDFQNKLQDYGSELVAGYDNLFNAAEAIKSNAGLLSTSAAAGDIPNSLTNSGLLSTSFSQLALFMQPINKQLILR